MGIFDDIRDGFDIEKDFTFDIEKARKELNSPDPISTILRGHLYVENSLDEMLKIELKRSDLIDLSKINFSVKPRLCVALGIIDQRTSSLCLKINKIRNSLAHHLDNSIDKAVLDDLLSEYHPELRHSFISSVEKEERGQFSDQNPTKIIAKLVKDFVGILQGQRRLHEIHIQKRDTALKIIIDVAKACRCCPKENE